MSFASKVVLVSGATGNIGNGAVANFLKAGAKVIAPVRSEGGVQQLRAKFNQYPESQLYLPVASISNPQQLEALRQDINSRYPQGLDHIVSSSGPWWNTPPLHELDYKTFKNAMEANFDAHFLLYSTFLKELVNNNGGYTFVTGAAGDMPASGLTGITQHALFGLIATAKVQTENLTVRVNELRIALRVESDEYYAELSEDKRKSVSHSEPFGEVFVKIANSSIKGKTLGVKNLGELATFNP